MPTPTHRLSNEIIDRLLPSPAQSVAQIEAAYPARKLFADAEVTRVAPSPTGFMHIGGIYAGLISERLAHQSGGIFYLRIEDTDRKREVEGARELIIDSFNLFNTPYDEGPTHTGELGLYGPYTQSHREEIYHAYVRKMLEEGTAYPCFVTSEEQKQAVEQQMAKKIRPGYYGEWAVWRDRSEQDVAAALDAGKPFVIRFRSNGDVGKKIVVRDVMRGDKEYPQNDNDIVVMKADSLPTYHLAHVVDDHLMGTTTVIRADEWLASATLHVQLAEALGVTPFRYAHFAPIQKMDGSSRRKLSKRKDPESSVSFYLELGYPTLAVVEYLLNQANASFEEWRRDNPHEPYTNFAFDIAKMPTNAGALLNMQKLDDVSRQLLARITPEQLYELAVTWAQTYDPELGKALVADPDYAVRVFSIEREGNNRKDIAKLSDIREAYGFFFDDIYDELIKDMEQTDISKISAEDRKAIAQKFLASYNSADSQEEWFEKLKALGAELGFTPDTREYRKNPDQFKGSVADVAMTVRVALAGRNRSPNLHEVLRVMGQTRLQQRISRLF
jgi:glutamyl-tRNA synthetase